MPRLSQEEASTIETYDMTAQVWASNHSTEGFWNSEMKRFQGLCASGTLLEIGSGGGRDAKILDSYGYNYIGTDISDGLIAEAKKVNPELPFVKSTLYELPFPENTFDAFWASAVLLHIPKLKVGAVLDELKRVCKPNAIGFIALKEGIGEKIEWDNRFFSYYAENEFTNNLVEHSFSIVESNTRSDSKSTTWITFLAKVEK